MLGCSQRNEHTVSEALILNRLLDIAMMLRWGWKMMKIYVNNWRRHSRVSIAFRTISYNWPFAGSHQKTRAMVENSVSLNTLKLKVIQDYCVGTYDLRWLSPGNHRDCRTAWKDGIPLHTTKYFMAPRCAAANCCILYDSCCFRKVSSATFLFPEFFSSVTLYRM